MLIDAAVIANTSNAVDNIRMEFVPFRPYPGPRRSDRVALDYPPLFAFFSYLLTLPARILLPNYASHLLELSSPPVEGSEVTAYMRGTVLLSELVMLVGLLR